MARTDTNITDLPPAKHAGALSLEQTIVRRRSCRSFTGDTLTLQQIAQLCWAGQGITNSKEGLRTVPSAGALYPVEMYIATGAGVDRYEPAKHYLVRHLPNDVRPDLQQAALDQEPVGQAPACFVVAAVQRRTERKYGNRAERYCFVEAGHVAQNILLQAEALDLAAVPTGAYEDRRVAKVLQLPKGQRVLYLLPIGHPRS